ncbi:hypothetical protein K1719_045292 [Acacia pycnantha]|nr:hypothetical protein K1719_045292 [Acacia pycnantha]
MTPHQQLNLFPLHPENLIHDKDVMHDDHNVAFLFTSHGPATLKGLLEQDSPTTTTTVLEKDSMTPQCLMTYPFDEDNRSSLMDRYQKVEKPRPETPIDENEIRITSQGRMCNHITYAMSLIQEKGSNEFFFKAMGRAINKTLTVVE